ncbi:wax ester/triacylglycerol synthase domain-containing protein [Panacagrimonas sp.]|uniref:wax ester/triacylglycerol synthase domain-containing protein n=1 Tax=Panacagrimonas sp. TaxID=2480088 RepID=UPI003B523D5E
MNTPQASAPISLNWGTAPALDAFETLMWRLDTYPNLRSAVVGIELLDCAPDRARMLAAHAWGVQAVPRLRHKLVEVPLGTPEWVDDAQFDLSAHLDFVTLPAPGSQRQLLDLAQYFAMEPFDRERPLWSARVVLGLDGARAAYILKLHHAMSDGIGIVQLMSFMHSRKRAPSTDRELPPAAFPSDATPPSPAEAARRQYRRELAKLPARVSAGVASLQNWIRPADDEGSRLSRIARYAASLRRALAPYMAPPSPLLAGRTFDWRFEAMEVPLSPFKAAAKACGASLNDAFVAGMLGGFARYHAHMGVEHDELPIGIPISVRAAGDTGGGNKFAPGQLAGKLSGATPQERMRHIGEQVTRLRDEPALLAPFAIMPLLARLPTAAVAKAMGPKMAANDLQMSNVPGIRDEVYMAGAKITHLFPYAPLPGVAGMIALVTHGQTCCIGLNLDAGAITEPEVLMRALRESFDEILELGVN